MNKTTALKEVYIAVPGRQRELSKLGPPLKGGAAGIVYAIHGDTSRVIKIYHPATLEKEGADYAARLEVMIAHPPGLPVISKPKGSPVAGPIIQIAWPEAIARDKKGKFVGFAMPAIEVIQTIDLEAVISNKTARALGLRHDLGSKLLLAHNLAAVVESIHAQGHAIVDLKPPNLRFYKHDLFMAVLDCDGFAVNVPGRKLAAPQFTLEYLAPEYQVTKEVTNPQQQDRFALAVIIFKLLNFGIHPYQGVATQSGIPESSEDKIANGLYAYGFRPHPDLRPVPASAHETLPKDIRELFDRAFGKIESLRPTATEWVAILARYAKSAPDKCANGHQHFVNMPCGKCLRDGVIQGASTKPYSTPAAARAPVPPHVPKAAAAPRSPAIIAASPPNSSGSAMGWLIAAAVVATGYFWLRSPEPAKEAAPPVAAAAVAAPAVVSSTSPTSVPAKRPYYGLVFAEGSRDGKVYIGAVDAAGPAAKAGIQAGDQIPMVNGQAVSSGTELERAIASANVDAGLTLRVRRGDMQSNGMLKPEMLEENEWSRRMAALQSAPPVEAVSPAPTLPAEPPKMRPSFGLSLRGAPHQPGLYVVGVIPGSRAAAAGLQLSDLIESLDGIPIPGPEDLQRALGQIIEERPVPFVVYRAGKTFKLEIVPVMISDEEWHRRAATKK